MHYPNQTVLPACVAKGMRPVPHALLHRERLYRILDRLGKIPLTWLAAPPGAGKTSLTEGYITSRKLDCIWYHLDKEDADPVRFFSCMTEIVKTSHPDLSPSLPSVNRENLQDMSLYAGRYFGSLLSGLPEGSLLVLDNYQEVDSTSELHQLMKECRKVIPEDVRIVIMSRDFPPASLAGERADGYLEIVDFRLIRFTLEETDEFIELMGLEKSFEELPRLLHEKTDGWIAGLILMMKRSDIREIHPGHVDKFTPLAVFEYFGSELFEKTDTEIRMFLMLSSFLPFMTVSMAEELTGNPDAEKILEYLNRRQFFIERRVGETMTYRYHQLFREFLLYKAENLIENRDLRNYKCKAAEILEKQGIMEKAFGLYKEIEAVDRMTVMIRYMGSALLFQNRYYTLENWISHIPDQVRRKDPWLLYWHGMCLLTLDIGKSKRLFDRALGLFESQGCHAGVLLCLSGLIHYNTFIFQPFYVLDPLIERINANRSHMSELFIGQKVVVVTSMLTALGFRSTGDGEYGYWKAIGEEMLTREIHPEQKIQIVQFLLWHAVSSGKLAEAFHYIRLYGSRADPEKISPLSFIFFETIGLYHSWLSAEFNRGEELYPRIFSVARDTGLQHMMIFATAHMAASHLSQGDSDRALDRIREMEPFCYQCGPWGQALYFVMRAWHAMLLNDIPQTDFYSEKACQNALESGAVQNYAVTLLGRSLSSQMQGNRLQAKNSLAEALDVCGSISSHQTEFACRLALAEVSLEENDRDSALEFLERALSIGRTFGYRNVFFWRPANMAKLCAFALEHDVETEYVRSLVKNRQLTPPATFGTEKWPWPLKIYTLGRFKIFRHEAQLTFKGKVPKRPLRLLKTLISMGGADVAETRLQDELWPDMDGDDAHNAFHMALHRLRKLLGVTGAVELSGGRVSFDPDVVWIDAFVLKDRMQEMQKCLKKEDMDGFFRICDAAFDLYAGPFLAGEEEAEQVLFRERITQWLLNLLSGAGRYLKNKERWPEAEAIFRRGLQIDPVSEDFCSHIMYCCKRQGRSAEAVSVYKDFKKKLAVVSGLAPGPEIISIYNSIKKSIS